MNLDYYDVTDNDVDVLSPYNSLHYSDADRYSTLIVYNTDTTTIRNIVFIYTLNITHSNIMSVLLICMRMEILDHSFNKQIMSEALPRALLLLTTYECSPITYFYQF